MKNIIHICILTTAHPADDGRVYSKIACSFLREGFRVTWVGPRHVTFDPTIFKQNEIAFILHPKSMNRINRLLAYKRIRRIAESVTCIDVYYCPDPDSAHLALKLARKSSSKVIFDIHEMYHGPMLNRWLFGFRLEFLRNYVRNKLMNICSRCDLVTGVNSSVLDAYTSALDNKLLLRSCAPLSFASCEPADVCGNDRLHFTIMHGKSDFSRGTKNVINALHIASRSAKNLKVVMFSKDISPDNPHNRMLFSLVHKKSIEHILDFRKGVPMKDMPDILRKCDVGLIAYGRDLGVDSLPNRLFEYMSVGLPIIAPSYAKEISNVITNEGCGLLADFENPESIAEAILKLQGNPELCREMGLRSRNAFLSKHNWEMEVQPMIETIKSWFPNYE